MGLCSCITDKEKENLYNDSFQKKNSGGDLFSIRTSVVYPADGRELIDYAAEEQDENARPELTSQIENLDQYGTIFVGYPNWLAYHKLIQCTQLA